MAHRFRSALVAGGLVTSCLAAAALGPALAAGVASPHIVAADQPATSSTSPANRVTVNGSGEVHVKPNMATVTLGVQVNRETAQAAQAAANSVIAATVKNLHALGISDRYIQTADMSLNPRYDDSGNVVGYQASQTLAVQVHGLQLVGRVVDAGVAAHANNNVGITFGLSDESAARTQALTRAIADARARAQAAAAALGLSLAGAHVQVSESGQPTPQPVVYQSAMRAPAAPPATQAFGGTLTIEEDVTLTYTF